MSDPRAQVIEAAVRPLAEDAEMKLAASQLLGEMLTSDPKGAEEATWRWDAMDGTKCKNAGFVGLCLLMVGVSVFAGIRDFREIVGYARWFHWASNYSLFSLGARPTQKPDHEYTARQKLLLFGDPTQSTQAGKKEALWLSEPDNVAFFAEYASAYVSENNRLPPNYSQTVRRMDPENAWFTYLAATVEAKNAVKSKRKSKMVNGKRVDQPPIWEVIDQVRMDRALALIREAGAQPNWDDYSAGLLAERIALLPQRNFLNRMEMLCVLSDNMMPSIRSMNWIPDVIAARARTLSEAGDLEGFQKISKDGNHFLRGILGRGSVTLLNTLVGYSSAMTISENFAEAARKLGITEDAAHWTKISDDLKEGKDARAFR